jgi:tetratricopeptide (TPR) repeat protein
MKAQIKSQLRRSRTWLTARPLQLQSFYWRGLTRIQPRNPWPYYHLAKAQLQQQNWSEAEALFRRCLALDKTIALAHHELGDVLQQQGKFEAAAGAYQQAIALNPEFSWSHHNLGDARRHQQDWQGAINAYQDAIQLAPDCFESHHNLAKTYSQAKQWQASATAYQKAIDLASQSQNPPFQLLYDYAGVLLRLKDTSTLSEVYLKTIDVDPEFSWFYHFIFWRTLKAEKRLPEAEDAYKDALKQHPNSTEVYINLGEALSHQDKISDALPYYQQALQQQLAKSHPELARFCEADSDRSDLKTKPDFIILGAQKAGTSSLYMYLTQHPNVIPALRKEVEFWSWKYRRGHDWYFAHFPPLPEGGKFLTGEACPGYLDFYVTPERIHEFLPQVKFIILFRNPVDRAISHYYHWVRRQQETLPLPEAIAAAKQELEKQGNAWDLPSNYLARGIYVEFVQHWLSLFPREQFLFLESEAFYQNPAASLKQVYQFLDISDSPLTDHRKYNAGSYRPAEADIRQELQAFYEPYNQELQTLLNCEFSW